MNGSRVGRLKRRSKNFPPKVDFVRPNSIVFVILLKLISIDHFIANVKRATRLDLRLFLIDFKMHYNRSEKLIGNLYLLVVLVFEHLFKERDFKTSARKQRSKHLFLFDIRGRKRNGHTRCLVADKCLPHTYLLLVIKNNRNYGASKYQVNRSQKPDYQSPI
jgi:hypothetical protein